MFDIQSTFSQLEKAVEASAPAQCAALIGELERLKSLALMHMLSSKDNVIHQSPPPKADTYLNVHEAAARFHVTGKWLYKNKKKLPHSQPSRKVLLFPEQPLARWFAARKSA